MATSIDFGEVCSRLSTFRLLPMSRYRITFFMILLENLNFSFFQVILTSQVHINKSITGAFLLPWLGDGLLLSAGWQ